MLRPAYEKCYNRSEPMAIDGLIVLFKGKIIFKQYIPYDSVYLGEDIGLQGQDVTATHAKVTQLTSKI
jgi:hypothetical protein